MTIDSLPLTTGRTAFRGTLRLCVFVWALAAVSACLRNDAAPEPFVGPSELALSLTLSASPDVLPIDGHSQSLLSILARDGAGQPIPNVTVRLMVRYAEVAQDIGSLSARTLVTGADGRVVATYTAPVSEEVAPANGTPPSGGQVDSESVVQIAVTPVGDNYAGAVGRTLEIRLVPSGTVVPPQAFEARGFRFAPEAPVEFQAVLFETGCVDQTDTECVYDPQSEVSSYVWDFGDGTTGSGATAHHAYSAAGVKVVTLTAIDEFGRSESTAKTVTVVTGGGPTAAFSFSPKTPNLGDTTFFNAAESTAPDGRSIVSYAWTFGDGMVAEGRTVSYQYVQEGTYSVGLTVTDDRGATGSASQQIVVGNSQPTASFVFSPTTPVVNTPVRFDASGSQVGVPGRSLVAFDWIFGDGEFAAGRLVSHSYAFASTFTATLIVTDSVGEQATYSETVTVGGAGGVPIASVTVSPSPTTVGRTVVVDASASRPSPGRMIVTYDWHFGDTNDHFVCPGDGACGTDNRTFPYVYTAAGTYTITLTVTDDSGSASTATVSVVVN